MGGFFQKGVSFDKLYDCMRSAVSFTDSKKPCSRSVCPLAVCSIHWWTPWETRWMWVHLSPCCLRLQRFCTTKIYARKYKFEHNLFKNCSYKVDIYVSNTRLHISNVWYFTISRYKDAYVSCIKSDLPTSSYAADARLKNVINVTKFESEINSICNMDISSN